MTGFKRPAAVAAWLLVLAGCLGLLADALRVADLRWVSHERRTCGETPGPANRARLQRASVCMAGKKKKGPSAAALEALEALEAIEAEEASTQAVLDLNGDATAALDEPKKAKKAKKGKKGKGGAAAAAALDALDALEANEPTFDMNSLLDSSSVAEEELPVGKKGKKGKKGKGGAAAAAALDALDALEANEPTFDMDSLLDSPAVAAEEAPVGKKGKKAKKKPSADALQTLGATEREEAAASLEDDLEALVGGGKKKKKNKQKQKQKGKAKKGLEETTVVAAVEESVVDAAASGAPLDMEARVRRERPTARVQIAESSQPGYVSLRLDKVSMYIKNQEVLKDASWEVKTGDRVGLVGANGCGKSTQLKILGGEVEPTSGDIIKSSANLRVAFLKQEFTDDLDGERTLRDELLTVFGEANDVVTQLSEVEAQLADPSVSEDPDKMQDALDRLATLQEDAERLGAFGLDTKVEKVLDMMGFTPADVDARVDSFSGGWKMRIGLGKILLQDPNLLLLDEPTNHLDLESVEWLEEFLRGQNLPMAIVSHDREFLDNVCTKIVDTVEGVTYSYDGAYSRFIKLKKTRFDAWQKTFDTQQKKIKDDRNWINQNKNKPAAASQVKQREKKIEQLMASEAYVQKPPRDSRKFKFRFPPAPRSGVDEIVDLDGITHGYADNVLFEDMSLTVEPNDRIAFLGPNGAGKSTLFRLIMGEESPVEGVVTRNEKVPTNFFAQNQADALDLDDTVMGVIEKAATEEHDYAQLRALLGQFLFKGDEVHKKIRQLSGGEKARVALCRMMLTPASLLVLDEPTNHLDIPAKEMLEEALQSFEGSMLLISHDRYFISQVATTICAVEDKDLELYAGDYKFYLENKPEVGDKVEARFVAGDSRAIGHAKVVEASEDRKKKNFGGSAVTSGDKTKGIKNAKRNNLV